MPKRGLPTPGGSKTSASLRAMATLVQAAFMIQPSLWGPAEEPGRMEDIFPATAPFPAAPFGVQYYLSGTPLPGSTAIMEILIPADRIQQRIAELSRQVAADYAGRPVTIIGVLTGSLMFL